MLDLRVLQLMNLTDSRLAQAGNERLELAMLSFFEQFRKIYIGDQVQKSSKVNGSYGGSAPFLWGGVACPFGPACCSLLWRGWTLVPDR